MKNCSRIALAITTVAAFAGSGSAALAEPPDPIGPADVAVGQPIMPLPGNDLPDLDLTDDPCGIVDAPCDDNDPDPGNPDPWFPGPGDLTDDPCNPAEEPCGPGPDDTPDPDETPEPDDTPEPEVCELDDVCTRTPTFTG